MSLSLIRQPATPMVFQLRDSQPLGHGPLLGHETFRTRPYICASILAQVCAHTPFAQMELQLSPLPSPPRQSQNRKDWGTLFYLICCHNGFISSVENEVTKTDSAIKILQCCTVMAQGQLIFAVSHHIHCTAQ